MSAAAPRLLVWVGSASACIRIAKRADFTLSVDFKELLKELLRRGCRCLVMDLSGCEFMDSTFLGVLATFGRELSRGNGAQAAQRIELYNASAPLTELLDTMGVLDLFRISQGTPTLPADSQPLERKAITPSKAEVSRTCIEAHQALMDISPANIARFKDVAQFLAESLKKTTPE